MKHHNGNRRGHIFRASLVAFALMAAQAHLHGQLPPVAADELPAERPPTLTVTGNGESSSPADRAVLHLGATVQAETASEAQEQVNAIMQKAIDAIRGVVNDEKKISTAGISLNPVYTDRQARPLDQQAPPEPRIVGYRAGNRLRIVTDDLGKVGEVIDAAVKAGANQAGGLSFELKDDTAARRAALTDAAKQARAKAAALAEALDVHIEGVQAVNEGVVNVVRPRMELARASVATMNTDTPVQPGNVEVDASVTVTYRISPGGGTKK